MPGRLPIALLAALQGFVVLLLVSTAHAQFYASCGDGSTAELDRNITLHAQHTFRMALKIPKYYYARGALPPEYEDARLSDVQQYLAHSGDGTGILFHAHEARRSRLCTWLITRGGITRHTGALGQEDHDALRQVVVAALDLPSRQRGRAPVGRGIEVAASAVIGDREAILDRSSDVLLPPPIARALIAQRIDTLIVVPHGEIGVVPFAALRIAGEDGQRRSLVELSSLLIAPGFKSFKTRPVPRVPGRLRPAIVAGDPSMPADPEYALPPLPGARSEAQEVAQILDTTALVGAAATRQAVFELASTQRTPELVYLATHGLADPVNPLDGSLLWLADGRWSAREIQRFPARSNGPLVVLSACQTGLGKHFGVGTIGMAQAWQLAGARGVVMSLWRVDDAATKKLMTEFIRLALTRPPDKALQAAMMALRATDPDPTHWASFAVFGLPER